MVNMIRIKKGIILIRNNFSEFFFSILLFGTGVFISIILLPADVSVEGDHFIILIGSIFAIGCIVTALVFQSLFCLHTKIDSLKL